MATTKKKLSKKSQDLLTSLSEAVANNVNIGERGYSDEWDAADNREAAAYIALQAHILRLEHKVRGMTVRLKVVKHGTA